MPSGPGHLNQVPADPEQVPNVCMHVYYDLRAEILLARHRDFGALASQSGQPPFRDGKNSTEVETWRIKTEKPKISNHCAWLQLQCRINGWVQPGEHLSRWRTQFCLILLWARFMEI